MPWITTKDGRQVNTDWFNEDERKKYGQIEKNEEEGNKKNGQSNTEVEYASDLNPNEKKKAKQAVNQLTKSLDGLVEEHNKNHSEDDLDDFLWAHIYDVFPRTLPDDQSILVFDNNRGNFDKEGKIGFIDLRIDTQKNKIASYRLKITYDYMDDFDDDYLEMMGIEK